MKLGGNFFEDLFPGQVLRNPVPRTLTHGDTALYIALTGDRNPKNCSDKFARALGFERGIRLGDIVADAEGAMQFVQGWRAEARIGRHA